MLGPSASKSCIYSSGLRFNDFRRHVLSNVSRVAARDSSRVVATAQDLFTALCEDSTFYGTFKSMKGMLL